MPKTSKSCEKMRDFTKKYFGVSAYLNSASKLEFWGEVGDQLPTFDAESKNAQIQKSHYGGGWGLVTNFQLLILSPNLQKSHPKSHYGGRGFQLLMLSPKMLKSQSPFTGGWGLVTNFQTFDAESKNAKIPKSHYGGGGGCV